MAEPKAKNNLSALRVHADVNYSASGVAVEEPGHTPVFTGERVDDVQTHGACTGIGLVDIIDKDGRIRIPWGSRIFHHDAELVAVGIGKRGNPTVIHDHFHTRNLHMLLKRLLEFLAVADCGDGHDAFNLHILSLNCRAAMCKACISRRSTE